MDELTTITIKTEKDITDHLDHMVKADDTDRSKFIRRLIRQEWEWRAANNVVKVGELPHPPDATPVPIIYQQRGQE